MSRFSEGLNTAVTFSQDTGFTPVLKQSITSCFLKHLTPGVNSHIAFFHVSLVIIGISLIKKKVINHSQKIVNIE